jgi:imidazolonepropionase
MATRRVFLDARQVLTMAGPPAARGGDAMARLGLLENASVVVENGRIAWVGASANLEPAARTDAVIVDCSGKALMPALVDPHTHLVWGGNRRDELEMRLAGADYEEIFTAGGGILSSVRQTRASDEETLFQAALSRTKRMRATGTTTFEIKSGYGLNLETELKQLRVARRLRDEAGLRVKTTCLVAHAVPAEHRGTKSGRADFVASICDEILPAVAKERLADYCDVFCDRGAFTPEESRRVLERAASLGMKLRVHANEFGQTGGARIAADLEAASADHLLHLDDEERSLLRDSGVVATLLPGTSLVLGKPFADGRALVDAGVPVAVATDCNPGSCALESLALVLSLACYGNRLSPAEAVCATTHNAAASLDLAHEVGRIEAGLSADLLLLATPDYRDLVYHAGSPLIDAVFQRGEQVHPQPPPDC